MSFGDDTLDPSYAQLKMAEDEIADLRKALSIVKAERDHWHALVPRADRVQFPFKLEP